MKQYMTEAEKRQRRCAFTGHRPEKLNISETDVRVLLQDAIEQAYADGFRVFISGMARGVDMWAADIVLQLRLTHDDIKLICAAPYEGFEARWSQNYRLEYQRIMQAADLVRYICPHYSPACFQIRNQWMVDHAARLIAVWNGQPSGTANTLQYAVQQDVNVIIIPAY